MSRNNEDMWAEANAEYRKWNARNRAFRYMAGGSLIDFEDLPITERNKWMKIVLLRKQNQSGDIQKMRETKRKIWRKEESDYKDKDLKLR